MACSKKGISRKVDGARNIQGDLDLYIVFPIPKNETISFHCMFKAKAKATANAEAGNPLRTEVKAKPVGPPGGRGILGAFQILKGKVMGSPGFCSFHLHFSPHSFFSNPPENHIFALGGSDWPVPNKDSAEKSMAREIYR